MSANFKTLTDETLRNVTGGFGIEDLELGWNIKNGYSPVITLPGPQPLPHTNTERDELDDQTGNGSV